MIFVFINFVLWNWNSIFSLSCRELWSDIISQCKQHEHCSKWDVTYFFHIYLCIERWVHYYFKLNRKCMFRKDKVGGMCKGKTMQPEMHQLSIILLSSSLFALFSACFNVYLFVTSLVSSISIVFFLLFFTFPLFK